MGKIEWRGQSFALHRVVIGANLTEQMTNTVYRLAEQHGFTVAGESVVPQPGDFWLGCRPVQGWGDDPSNIRHALGLEVFSALGQIAQAHH